MAMSNAIGRNVATTIKGQAIVCRAMSKSLNERIDLVEEAIAKFSSVDSLSSIDSQVLKQLCDNTTEFAECASKVAQLASRYAQLAKIAAEKLSSLTTS